MQLFILKQVYPLAFRALLHRFGTLPVMEHGVVNWGDNMTTTQRARQLLLQTDQFMVPNQHLVGHGLLAPAYE